MEENKSYKLTDEEQKKISEELENLNKKDFEETVKAEREENPVSGLPKVVVDAQTNTETGETVLGSEVEGAELAAEEIFANFGKAITAANKESPIDREDVVYALEQPTVIGNLKGISDEAIDKLTELVNYRINNIDSRIKYTDLPDEIIDKSNLGSGLRAPMNMNSIMNEAANNFISEILDSATINSTMKKFNEQTNALYMQAQNEIFPMLQEYEKNKEKALRESIKDIDDPKERQEIEDTLDAMADAYSLNPLKEAAPKIKIKKYDLERPTKIFDDIHIKYHKDPRYNIYTLTSAAPVLSKNLYKCNKITKEDADKMTSANKFLIAFAKYCQNFHLDVVREQSFMYYVVYNIYLLSVYHGEAYDTFANPFLTSVMEVVANVRGCK